MLIFVFCVHKITNLSIFCVLLHSLIYTGTGWARRNLLLSSDEVCLNNVNSSSSLTYSSTNTSTATQTTNNNLATTTATSNTAHTKKGLSLISTKLNTDPPTFKLANKFQVKDGWMGNHVFLCNGKIMLGSDAPLFYVTNVILVLGMILYFGFVLPHLVQFDPRYYNLDDSEENGEEELQKRFHTMQLWTTHSYTIIISIITCMISYISLWICATTDPGILPPNSSPIHALPPLDSIPNGGCIPIGGPLGYKYCTTCNIYRPPRSKHCNSCNVCVSKFDQ